MFESLYVWTKLIHVVSALAFFGLYGAIHLHMRELKRAPEFAGLRAANARLTLDSRLFLAAILVLLASGLFMVATAWGWGVAWANLSLGLFLTNFVLGSAIDQPWFKAVQEAASGKEGPLTAPVRALLADRRFALSYTLKGGVNWALVFLMTVKPALWVALGGAALIVAAYLAYSLRPKPGPVGQASPA